MTDEYNAVWENRSLTEKRLHEKFIPKSFVKISYMTTLPDNYNAF